MSSKNIMIKLKNNKNSSIDNPVDKTTKESTQS